MGRARPNAIYCYCTPKSKNLHIYILCYVSTRRLYRTSVSH